MFKTSIQGSHGPKDASLSSSSFSSVSSSEEEKANFFLSHREALEKRKEAIDALMEVVDAY